MMMILKPKIKMMIITRTMINQKKIMMTRPYYNADVHQMNDPIFVVFTI
jgi:hypothetical protein